MTCRVPRCTLLLALALALAACSSAQMCERRGGVLYASEIDPRLPSSCVMPAVDGGNPCTEAEHCGAGYCACSDDRRADGSHVADGGAMTGVCPSFPAQPDDAPVCTVVGGSKRHRPPE